MYASLLAFASLIAAVGLSLALFTLYWVLSTSPANLPVTTDWIAELSVERYRPMLRLLDHDDLRFVQSQPGCTPQIVARLRRQRYRLFLMYLRDMSQDFRRICAALKLIMIQSERDRPDLASTLVRAQWNFSYGMVQAHTQAYLWRWGVGTVNLSSLIGALDGLRTELSALVPAQSFSA